MVTQARRLPLPALSGRLADYITPVFAGILVVLLVVWLGVNLYKTPDEFYRLFLIGLTNGAIYGLVALGYSLVYGILELINFAHGDVFMLGGMLVATMVSSFGLAGESGIYLWSMILLMLVIVIACAVLNTTIELVAYRRLRHAPRLAPLSLRSGCRSSSRTSPWSGRGAAHLGRLDPPEGRRVHDRRGRLHVGQADRPPVHGSRVVLLMLLVQRTRQGKAMRATAQDRDASAMMGINVNRTISFTFFLAGGLAGAAGLLYALYITNIRYDGFSPRSDRLHGSRRRRDRESPRRRPRGLVIAMIESFNNGLSWATPGSDWTQSIIFAILIIILVFRPEGLLGERTPEGG